MSGRREGDGCRARAAGLAVAAAVSVGVGTIGSGVAHGAESAQPIELWASNAPLSSVLEHIIDEDAFEVRIAENVQGLVSGRLEGTVGEVLEPLLDSYGLTVHHDGQTVWFDRRGQDVVELARLDAAREPALAAWAATELEGPAPNGKGQVERDDDALVVSGTRAFVIETLARLEAARGALGAAATEDAANETVRDGAAAMVLSEASETPAGEGSTRVAASAALALETSEGSAPDIDLTPRFRSVTDVPGYHTEYR